jgi:hypothetical protein
MREPVNRARGEVLLEIDGASQRLCVTLGALAGLEAAFDVGSLAELGERLAQLTASDLITVVAALSGVGAAELSRAEIDPRAAASAVAEAFRLAFDE